MLDSSRSPALTSQNQNAGAPSGAVGTLVSALVDFASPAGQVDNVVDEDNTDGDGPALLGIAVTAADTASGTWFYSINGGVNWNALGSVSSSSSRLLAADANTRLYFQPTANFNGTLASAITFRAWDRTSGVNGSLASTASNGGTSAFSTATDTASLTVLAPLDISFVGASSDGALASDTTLTVAVPAGTASGNVMIASVAVAPSTVTITAPSGWTLIRRTDNATGSQHSLATYYRVASISEPASYTWTVSSTSVGSVGGIQSYSGVSTNSPIDVHGGAATASSLSHAAPSVTATVADSALLTFHSFSSSAVWTPPSGMFEIIDDASTSIGGNGVSLEGNVVGLSSAGATGTRTATASGNSDVGCAQSIVLRPAPYANVAPVLDASKSPALATLSEGAGAPSGAAGTLVSSLVDFASPSGQVDNVTDPDSGAVLGIAITGTDSANGTLYYTIDNGGIWTAAGAVSHASALLLAANGSTRVYFQPNSSGVISEAITFRAWDQTSGANGSSASVAANGGITAFSTDTDSVSLIVTAVNDAPVLDNTKLVALNSITEDAGVPVGAVGTLISSLVDFASPSGQVDNVTDPNAGALLGIAVTAANTANGAWYYSIDGGSVWSVLGSVSDGNARLLAADADNRIYFQPNANFNGVMNAAIAFRAWDQTSGTDGGLASATVNGDATAFSTATDTASLVVVSVIDVPLLTIVRTNGFNALISWPDTEPEFLLESSSTLTISNSWTTVGETRSTNAGSFSVTVPMTNSNAFYRLRLPQ